MLLHKLIEAHEPLLTMLWPLSAEQRALLEQRQKTYEPVLEAIEKEHVGHDGQYGAILQRAVAFARKLLEFPSLHNPQQDALRKEYNEYNEHDADGNKRKRARATVARDASPSTDAPVGSGAAFVALLAYVSR